MAPPSSLPSSSALTGATLATGGSSSNFLPPAGFPPPLTTALTFAAPRAPMGPLGLAADRKTAVGGVLGALPTDVLGAENELEVPLNDACQGKLSGMGKTKLVKPTATRGSPAKATKSKGSKATATAAERVGGKATAPAGLLPASFAPPGPLAASTHPIATAALGGSLGGSTSVLSAAPVYDLNQALLAAPLYESGGYDPSERSSPATGPDGPSTIEV